MAVLAVSGTLVFLRWFHICYLVHPAGKVVGSDGEGLALLTSFADKEPGHRSPIQCGSEDRVLGITRV